MADVTVESGDFIVTSSGESEDAIRAAMLESESADTPAVTDDAQDAPDESASEDAPEPEADSPEDAPDEQKPEPKKLDKRTKAGRQAAIQQEIDALIAQRTEARKALDAERAQLESLRQSQAPALAADDPEPQEAQFDDYGQYVKAQARWEARQEFRAQQQNALLAQQQQLAAREFEWRVQNFKSKIDEENAKTPDWLNTVNQDLLSIVPISAMSAKDREQATAYNALAEELLRTERPVEMLRHFSEHPEEVQRLVTLPPHEFMRQMARIEARLDVAATVTPTTPKTPPLSQAKPPIRAMGSVPSAGDDGELSDDLPVEEYIRRANAQDRQRRAGR